MKRLSNSIDYAISITVLAVLYVANFPKDFCLCISILLAALCISNAISRINKD